LDFFQINQHPEQEAIGFGVYRLKKKQTSLTGCVKSLVVKLMFSSYIHTNTSILMSYKRGQKSWITGLD
jgi:hypothetical protein